MEKSSPDDLIKVWVWLNDINMAEASRRIESTTGYTEDDIKSIYNDEDFTELAEIFCDFGSSGRGDGAGKDKSGLLKQAKEKNKEKREIVKKYKRERLKVYDSMYTEHNNSVIDSLNLDRDRISFICTLTPSFIIELTPDGISNLTRAESVNSLMYCDDRNTDFDYNEDTEELPDRSGDGNVISNAKLESMHSITAMDTYGYTGEGVNILMLGGTGYINLADPDDLDMVNPETVENVYNNQTYPITEYTTEPYLVHDGHAHHCTKVLKQYAPDSHVYVVQKRYYSDIINTIISKDIDIVNASICYSIPDVYDSYARWFDALASICNIPLIASAGNESDWNFNYPRAITPANGYNSIAVGTYTADSYFIFENDRMRDFRYSPTNGNALPTYKPDVVVASDDTSSAAPALTGIISWALEMNSDLLNKPQAVKAIVLASCHRKALPAEISNGVYDQQETMAEGLTVKQGAGIADAYRILKAAAERTYGIVTLTPNSTYYNGNIQHHVAPGHYGTVDFDDYLNVSTAWYVKYEDLKLEDITIPNDTSNNNSGAPNNNLFPTTLNVQYINLKIMDGNAEKAVSIRINSCKQMAYTDDTEGHHTYQIRIDNVTSTANMREVDVGYAWTERGRCELTSLNLQGEPSVGSTLQANAIMTNAFSVNAAANSNELTYTWERSSDGVNWTVLSRTQSSYHLNYPDYQKYIRCTVTPRTTSLLAPRTVSAEVYINTL
jgi:hypothetical protein